MKLLLTVAMAGLSAVMTRAEMQISWSTSTGVLISNHLNDGGTITSGVAQLIYSKDGTADSGLVTGSFADWSTAKSWVANSSDEIILAEFTFTSSIKQIAWTGTAPAGSDAQFASSNPNVTVDGTLNMINAWTGASTPGLTASSILYCRVIEEVGSSGYSAWGGQVSAVEKYNIGNPPAQAPVNVASTGANGWVTTATDIPNQTLVRAPGSTSGKGWSSFTVVPEPATFGLFAVAAAGLAFRRRKLL